MTMRGLVLLVLAAGLSVAADDKDKDVLDKEYAKFEGTWQIF